MQNGIYIAFEPQFNQEGETYAYDILLINYTQWKIVFDGWMFLGEDEVSIGGSLDSQKTDKLDILPKHNLNDYPEIEITVWRWTTAGQDGKVVKNLKIKPKQFFKKIADMPLTGSIGHVYQVAEDFAPPLNRENTLKSYTLNNLPDEEMPKSDLELMKIKLVNLEARASFPDSIDLHVQNLTPDYKKLDAAAAFMLQMEHFEKYLEQAILLGMPYVYIVHGKGKGRLREEVQRRLKEHSGVVDFESGYHEGYGAGGATKVIL